MDEMLKEIYVYSVTNELSPDQFIDVYKDTLAKMGILDTKKNDELYNKCWIKIKNILEVTEEELNRNVKRRYRNYVVARQWKMFLNNRLLYLSLSLSGKSAGKDHVTVIHANKSICNSRNYDKFFKVQFREVIEELEKENPYIFNYE